MKHLNEKLELLHVCLMKDGIPAELPKVLERYQYDFVKFNEVAQTCESSIDEKYVNALRIFRNILLK